MGIQLESIKIEVQEGHNIILGQTHFIKSIEDLAEILISSGAGIKFGVAFCEASGPCLIRYEGNETECVQKAISFADSIGAGHSFCVVLGKGSYPINVLDRIKACPEVCAVFCATANPVEVIIASTGQGRAILGIVDGYSPKGVENDSDKKERKEMLRKFGYKF